MYISIEEMKSVLYEYRMNEIVENDPDIIEDAIMSAEAEVRSYFEAANARRETANLTAQQYAAWYMYDVEAIFSTTGNQRDRLVMRLVQRVAAWNLCELCNADIVYNHVKERYENTIALLEKIAGMGDWKDSRIVLNSLPRQGQDDEETDTHTTDAKPFRMVSRPKFNHEEI
jgi:hypothetical protein